MRHGIPVWYSPLNLRGAQEWHDEIGRALRRCDWFALLLSPTAIRSEWVQRELFYALQKKQYRRHIVPLLLKRCRFEKLSWTLGGIHRVDFTGSYRAGCRALLRVWDVGYDDAEPRQAKKKKC